MPQRPVSCRCCSRLRLVEEVKEKCGGVALTNEDVYMATTYKDFVTITVLKSRGVSLKKPFTYDAVSCLDNLHPAIRTDCSVSAWCALTVVD